AQRAFQRLLSETIAAAPLAEEGEEPPKKNGQAEWSRVAPEVLRLLCGQVGLPPPEAEDFRAILGPEVIAEAPPAETAAPLPAAPLPRGTQPLYVLTEKILGPDEPL